MSDSDPDQVEPVFRLIYRSQSLIGPNAPRAELGAIFNTARRNNRRLGVTGALVISEDAFVQALEGNEAVVRNLYETISHDERHESVSVLEEQTVPERVFARWAMAKVAADDGPDIRLLSNASRGMIVSAPGDPTITAEQEAVLAFMRDALAGHPA